MLVINGDDDFIVDRNSEKRWQPFLKRGDRYVSVPNGRHFMQHTHAQEVSCAITSFAEMTPDPAWLEIGIQQMKQLWKSPYNG
jgi:pimeloyl-ACP methyl ester carboxylesterase